MNKQNMKKLLLKALIIGGITIGAINITTINVQATQIEQLNRKDLSYEQYRLIRKYSDIFNIDFNYVLECLGESLDRPDDLTSIYGVQYESEEIAILTFIYQLAFKPDKLGYKKDDIQRVDTNYEMKLSHEEMIYYYANLLGVDYEIALSISYAECGANMDSYNYLNNNNPAGIGPRMKFNNKEEGIIYFIFLLKNGYKLGEKADDEFINRIASTYCPDDPNHWISLVNKYYPNVQNDYFYYNQEIKEEYKQSSHAQNNEYEIIEKLNEHFDSGRPDQKIKTIRKIKSAKH